MISRREVTNKLADWTLEAGEGTLLLVGTETQFEADCRLMGDEPAR
ncbi:MAG: hypothetical protein ACYTG0_07455 [Planctomycetota bacterium]|jgi:hypothetical protein